eukprot:13545942-Ditylum_brightwellii.AAC.1
MDDYIAINFKRADCDFEDGNVKSSLLERIYSTVEKQKNDDTCNIKRSTATLPAFVEKAYSKVDLHSEYAKLKTNWDDGMGVFP